MSKWKEKFRYVSATWPSGNISINHKTAGGYTYTTWWVPDLHLDPCLTLRLYWVKWGWGGTNPIRTCSFFYICAHAISIESSSARVCVCVCVWWGNTTDLFHHTKTLVAHCIIKPLLLVLSWVCLCAVQAGLEEFHNGHLKLIHVYTWPSSSYLLDTFSKWIDGAKLAVATRDIVTVSLAFSEGVAVESCYQCKALLGNSEILDRARVLNRESFMIIFWRGWYTWHLCICKYYCACSISHSSFLLVPFGEVYDHLRNWSHASQTPSVHEGSYSIPIFGWPVQKCSVTVNICAHDTCTVFYTSLKSSLVCALHIFSQPQSLFLYL